MEIQGKVYKVGQVETIGQSFTKRELIIVTDGQYPQHISIETHKDKTSLLDGLKIGEAVNVSININGRLWTNPQGVEKCFNTLAAWKIEKLGSEMAKPQSTPPRTPQNNAPAPVQMDEENLPF